MDDFEKYCDCMEEIKKRISVIQLFLNVNEYKKESPITKQPIIDIEFLCLQFRKILELIAFSTLTAHRKKYENIRATYHLDWRADKILDLIAKINPDFFPIPIREEKVNNSNKIKWVKISDGFLTKLDFKDVFNKCCDFLHSQNPYITKATDLLQLRKDMRVWLQKAINLLNIHQVCLPESDKILIVHMKEKDGKVYAYEFEKIIN